MESVNNYELKRKHYRKYPIMLKNYHGEGGNSNVYLKPAAIYLDPFMLGGENRLVLCETYDAHQKNQQVYAIGSRWMAIWMAEKCFSKSSRSVEKYHYRIYSIYRACLYAGLDISRTNAEVMPGQWEYQIGPTGGIAASDQLWISRYILQRIGDWSGAGCHANFSVEEMRKPGGIKAIKKAIEKLSCRQELHIKHYDPTQGVDNTGRLTSKHERASYKEFSAATASRNVSIRIPRQVDEEQCGYFEDRRPAANCDPYAITYILVKTTCLDADN